MLPALTVSVELPSTIVSRNQLDHLALQIGGIPLGTEALAIYIFDDDTPPCRLKQAQTSGTKPDAFVQGWVEKYGEQQLLQWPVPFVHAIIWQWPLDQAAASIRLQLDHAPKGVIYGPNSANRPVWTPFEPPAGDPIVHHYQFKVLALRGSSSPPSMGTPFKASLWDQLKEQALAEGETVYSLLNAQIQK